MLQEAIAAFLSERIGLESESIPRRTLSRIVRQRMDACGVIEEAAYLKLVSSSPQELEEFVEALVVPETWFFRDFEPFVFLRKYVLEEWLPSLKQRPLRILSAPGSTGEEPYSIAMTVLDAGLSKGDVSIDSLDISRKAMEKATQASYGSHSFREKDEEFRRKYFHKDEETYRLIPEVRELVHFVLGNLLDRIGTVLMGPYDIIFFRNLLIYFNDKARKKAVRTIDGLLRDDGLLFLGYAEAQRLFFPYYAVVDHPRCFAVRKAIKPTAEDRKKKARKEPRGPSGESNDAEPPARKTASPGIPSRFTPMEPERGSGLSLTDDASVSWTAREPDVKETDTKGEWGRARRLADAGKLDEAASLCRDLIRMDAGFADAYSLLGVIALAQGDEERALENFNKVVYLEPDNRDVLFHLSLLMDKRGMRDQAERFRERLLRANDTDG